jgi:hypothetical protein
MGSSHSPKSTRVHRGRSDRTSPKPRRKPVHPKPTKLRTIPESRSKRAKLPDLAPILHAFSDALALVSCAYVAMSRRNDYGDEEPVLRMGRDALLKVYNALDAADLQFDNTQEGERS